MAATRQPRSAQAHLEARISQDLHAMLKRAAAIQGRSMTDFVVTAVEMAARRAIEDAEILRLSPKDQAFVDTLIKPPTATAALKRAAKRHMKLVATS